MSTITRTATLESALTDAGIVSLAAPSTYSYITNPTDPEISFVEGTKGDVDTTKLPWFQFNFNSISDSDYSSSYIATNIDAVSVADFRYDVNFVSGIDGSPDFVVTTHLPNGVVTSPSASVLYLQLASATTYGSAVRTLGAQTTDLDSGGSSTAFADIKTAIQNIEDSHDSATSDNGKWAFGGKTSVTAASAITRFDRDDSSLTNGFFLDITYTVTIVAPTIAVDYSGTEARLSVDDALSSTDVQWEFIGPEGTFALITNATSGVILDTNIEVNSSNLTELNVVPKEFKAYSVRARQLIESVWRDWSTTITVSSQKTKKLRPRVIYPALVDDSFKLVTLSNWTDASSAFTSNEAWLTATRTGSLVYNGTALNTLKIFNESTRANYRYIVRFLGKTNLKFTLLGRTSVTLNFADSSIELFDGNAVSLGKITHNLANNKNYTLELYSYESNHIVLLNSGELLRKDWVGGYADHTFSLRVDTLPSDSKAVFQQVMINEVWNQVAPTKENTSDINLDFRRSMINFIDNEDNKTWRNWVKARNIWRRGLNMGQPDATWIGWGYPIYEPSSEEWFVTTTTIS